MRTLILLIVALTLVTVCCAKRKACRYKRGGAKWSKCVEGKMSLTKVLREGSADKCDASKIIERPCGVTKCKYSKGDWSDCDEAGMQTRSMTLQRGGSQCPATKSKTRACKKGCKYEKGNWSECNTTTNKVSRILTLVEGGDHCLQQKLREKPCRKAKRAGRKGSRHAVRLGSHLVNESSSVSSNLSLSSSLDLSPSSSIDKIPEIQDQPVFMSGDLELRKGKFKRKNRKEKRKLKSRNRSSRKGTKQKLKSRRKQRQKKFTTPIALNLEHEKNNLKVTLESLTTVSSSHVNRQKILTSRLPPGNEHSTPPVLRSSRLFTDVLSSSASPYKTFKSFSTSTRKPSTVLSHGSRSRKLGPTSSPDYISSVTTVSPGKKQPSKSLFSFFKRQGPSTVMSQAPKRQSPSTNTLTTTLSSATAATPSMKGINYYIGNVLSFWDDSETSSSTMTPTTASAMSSEQKSTTSCGWFCGW